MRFSLAWVSVNVEVSGWDDRGCWATEEDFRSACATFQGVKPHLEAAAASCHDALANFENQHPSFTALRCYCFFF